MVSSMISLYYVPNSVLYSASKAFMNYLGLAIGFETSLVDVQCICPGPIVGVMEDKKTLLEKMVSVSPKPIVEASIRDMTFGCDYKN